MKKRRIEITVSRRRTTFLVREQADGAAIEPSRSHAAALPPAVDNLSPAIETELLHQEAAPPPHATLALNNLGTKSHLSEVECQAGRIQDDENEKREVFGKCE